MEDVTIYLARLKDRIYYLLVLKERECKGEEAHFAECAISTSERMIGALRRYPELKEQDIFTDAIDSLSFCAGDGVSFQHVRTHILNTINDIDRLITKLEV